MTNRELQRILEIQEQAQKAWDAHGDEILRSLRMLEEQYRSVWRQVGDQVRQYFEIFEKRVAPHLEDVRRAIQSLPPRIKRIVLYFAGSGWFLNPWLGFVEFAELQTLAEQDNLEVIDHIMVPHFRGKIDEIELSLESQFPSRASILKSAFALHKDSKFEASIPLFLIQADGICHEILGVQLFRQRKPGVPATARAIEAASLDPLEAAVIEPLRVLLPVSYHTSKIDLSSSVLNRHAILHGLTTAYPSEVNSLKAISLLYFVSTIRLPNKGKDAAAT